MTDLHTQTQIPGQEPVRVVAAPKTTAASVIYRAGPGLVATDGFHPTPIDDGRRVLVWFTPTPQERQLIVVARWGEPLPRAQINHTIPPPVLPHDETEPVRVMYHTGRSGTEASQHPAEFARQLSRQYEALSYLTVDGYLKGHNLHNIQKRVPNSPAIETDRDNLQDAIVDRLVDEYRFDPNEAEGKAVEAVQALAALHEPDQSLRNTHQLATGEIVWGNSSVSSSIDGQHKAGLVRLGEKTYDAQVAGKRHHHLNVRVVLCDNSRLASRIRRSKTKIVFDPEEHKKRVSHHTRADLDTLAGEIRNRYPHLSHDLPQPITMPTQPDNTDRISQVKNILAAALPEPATPTKPHTTLTRPHSQSTRNRTRNRP